MKAPRAPGAQQKPQQKVIMNWQKFFTAFIAAFIFLFVFGFLWYGTLMRPAHEEVSALFKAKPDFPWLILGHLVMAFFFAMLCVRFVPPGGIGASAALGILVGLTYAGAHVVSFAVEPLTTKILWGWIAGGVIQFAIAGAIVGAIYKPAPAHITFVKERSR
ncbi:MAG: hypothetical protein DME51_06080 [Verrucomicrobia bacterium]|nr:MAG: hypothetical protein DME51_06080 [Verrucomicrobiota bacterium]